MSVPISLDISGSCTDGDQIVVDGDLPNLRCQSPVPAPTPKIIKQTTVIEKPYQVTVTKDPEWLWYLIPLAAVLLVGWSVWRYRKRRTDIYHHKSK